MNDQEFAKTWIYSAVYILNKGEVSLSELIGSADGLNHAIPTIEEICIALSFMEAHDLVKVSNKTIHTTAFGNELFSAAKKRRGGWYKIPDNVLFVFNKKLSNEKEVKVKQYSFLNDESINKAYEEYVTRSRGS
ncbi:MAG: hypothetical protein KME36_13940 [Candidatus Thiodiazotropha sp. (ex Lucina pensylvanica)]|nr:hypothetical protein [Candidatus Thiodiazotropha sp. (ex Lucina pensylvanica)]MBT3051528.1 hypothetical protein [Candidatus Thiodiazotropha sp. (ex Codakia orbicularis)]